MTLEQHAAIKDKGGGNLNGCFKNYDFPINVSSSLLVEKLTDQ